MPLLQRKDNNTSISGHCPQFSMHDDLLGKTGNCRVFLIILKSRKISWELRYKSKM